MVRVHSSLPYKKIALIFLFFAPNVNAKAFSATFYFYSLIIPHLMLAYGKRKAMLCQGGTTLNINHSTFGSVQKVGVGGFTLKLSFKGPQIRVHSILPLKLQFYRGFYLGTQENTIVFSFAFITNFLTTHYYTFSISNFKAIVIKRI